MDSMEFLPIALALARTPRAHKYAILAMEKNSCFKLLPIVSTYSFNVIPFNLQRCAILICTHGLIRQVDRQRQQQNSSNTHTHQVLSGYRCCCHSYSMYATLIAVAFFSFRCILVEVGIQFSTIQRTMRTTTANTVSSVLLFLQWHSFRKRSLYCAFFLNILLKFVIIFDSNNFQRVFGHRIVTTQKLWILPLPFLLRLLFKFVLYGRLKPQWL